MGDGGRQQQPAAMVVVAAAGTLQRADVIRATLGLSGIDAIILGENATNTLSHVALGINPAGIRVAVAAEDAERARAVLDQPPARPDSEAWPDDEPAEAVSEACARRAMWAALLSWFCPVLAPAALYNFAKALRAAATDRERMVDPSRYRKRMKLALLLALPPLVFLVAVVAFGAFGLLIAPFTQ